MDDATRKIDCMRNSRYVKYWRDVYNLGDTFSDMVLDYLYDKKKLDAIPNRKIMSFIGSEIPYWASDDVLVAGLGWQYRDPNLRCRKVPPSNFCYVRGKISRSRVIASGVAIPEDLPIGDTGLLASLLYTPISEKKYDIGIITHWTGAGKKSEYVNSVKGRFPGRSIEIRSMNDLDMNCVDLFEFIVSCRIVLCSSLHAVIFAHSFGVPALFFSGVDGYKFQDYYSVFDRISYEDLDRGTTISDAADHIDDLTFVESVNPTRDEVIEVQRTILGALPYQECLNDFGSSLLEAYPRCSIMQCRDEDMLRKSSAGGFIPKLMELVESRGGTCFGVVFSDDFRTARYVEVTDANREAVRGSKYIEAELGQDILDRIKGILAEGREVLFVGTPCKCHIVRCAFPNDRKLMIVQILCHGVPEDSLWTNYVKTVETENCGLTGVFHRDKSISWEKFCIRLEFKDGKEIKWPFSESRFGREYLSDRHLKDKCRHCRFGTSVPCLADIVTGDAWGVLALGENPGLGWSIVLANTPSGKRLVGEVSRDFKSKAVSVPALKNLEGRNMGLKRLALATSKPDKSYWYFSEKPSVAIWVSYHKDSQIGEYGLKEDATHRLFATHKDAPLENINHMNTVWSEVVTLWYVYHNRLRTDLVGFSHYRRQIKPSRLPLPGECAIFTEIRCGTVYDQYRAHYIKDMDLVLDILDELHGKGNPYSLDIRNASGLICCNCFVMRWKDFISLGDFLFPVIDEFSRRTGCGMDPSAWRERTRDLFKGRDEGTITYQTRVVGFLAERLVSAYIHTHLKFYY